MRIVVDTNIVFSAILNTNSQIAKILLQPRSKLNFYSTQQLLLEIGKHKLKIKRISNYSDEELERVIFLITKKDTFHQYKIDSKRNL